jgi:hypothetical protein
MCQKIKIRILESSKENEFDQKYFKRQVRGGHKGNPQTLAKIIKGGVKSA